MITHAGILEMMVDGYHIIEPPLAARLPLETLPMPEDICRAYMASATELLKRATAKLDTLRQNPEAMDYPTRENAETFAEAAVDYKLAAELTSWAEKLVHGKGGMSYADAVEMTDDPKYGDWPCIDYKFYMDNIEALIELRRGKKDHILLFDEENDGLRAFRYIDALRHLPARFLEPIVLGLR